MIELLGSKAVVSDVSINSEGLIVPLLLTTYTDDNSDVLPSPVYVLSSNCTVEYPLSAIA